MSIYATLALDDASGFEPIAESESRTASPLVVPNHASSPSAIAPEADVPFDPWHWRPSVSAPHVERTLVVHSVFAQKTLRTLFGRLQMAAYGMSVTIPIMERDQGGTSDTLERTFVASLERVLAMQAKTRERCRHWLGGQTALPGVRYWAQTETLLVYTPMANHALSVFQGLDETIMLIDELWYSGVLSASQAKRAILEARAQVKNFVNEMDGLWRRSKASVRRLQTVLATAQSPGSPSIAEVSPNIS